MLHRFCHRGHPNKLQLLRLTNLATIIDRLEQAAKGKRPRGMQTCSRLTPLLQQALELHRVYNL